MCFQEGGGNLVITVDDIGTNWRSKPQDNYKVSNPVRSGSSGRLSELFSNDQNVERKKHSFTCCQSKNVIYEEFGARRKSLSRTCGTRAAWRCSRWSRTNNSILTRGWTYHAGCACRRRRLPGPCATLSTRSKWIRTRTACHRWVGPTSLDSREPWPAPPAAVRASRHATRRHFGEFSRSTVVLVRPKRSGLWLATVTAVVNTAPSSI